MHCKDVGGLLTPSDIRLFLIKHHQEEKLMRGVHVKVALLPDVLTVKKAEALNT